MPRRGSKAAARIVRAVAALALLLSGAAVVTPSGPARAEDTHSEEARDLQAIMRMKGRSDQERIRCMSGAAEQDIRASYDAGIRPDLGQYCVLHLEESAEAERNPQALQQRPDKALLAPYQRLAREKGFAGEPRDGRTLLEAMAALARDPRSADTIGPVRQPLSNGKALVLVPGVAWDAGFTNTLLTGGSDRPEGTRLSRRALIAEAARCFTNAQQFIQPCYQAGAAHARAWLAGKARAETQ